MTTKAIEFKIKPFLQGGKVADIEDLAGALITGITADGLVSGVADDGSVLSVQLDTSIPAVNALIAASGHLSHEELQTFVLGGRVPGPEESINLPAISGQVKPFTLHSNAPAWNLDAGVTHYRVIISRDINGTVHTGHHDLTRAQLLAMPVAEDDDSTNIITGNFESVLVSGYIDVRFGRTATNRILLANTLAGSSTDDYTVRIDPTYASLDSRAPASSEVTHLAWQTRWSGTWRTDIVDLNDGDGINIFEQADPHELHFGHLSTSHLDFLDSLFTNADYIGIGTGGPNTRRVFHVTQDFNRSDWRLRVETVADEALADGDEVSIYFTQSEVEAEQQLPEFPATGERDNKVPKFDGDVLGWEPDAVGAPGAGTAVVPNPAGTDGVAVSRLSLDGTNYNLGNYRIIFGANGVLRDPSAADYDTVAAVSKVLGVNDDRIYVVIRESHGTGSTLAVSWEDHVPTITGKVWRGFHGQDSDVTLPVAGNVYGNTHDREFRERHAQTSGGVTTFWWGITGARPANFVGWWDDEDEADDHVTAVGQLSFYPIGSTWKSRQVTAYTAPDPVFYTYRWKEIHERLPFFVRPDQAGHLPLPTVEQYENGVPAIQDGFLFKPYRTLQATHSARSFWREINQAGNEVAVEGWNIGQDYVKGEIIYEIYQPGGYYQAQRDHTALADDVPDGEPNQDHSTAWSLIQYTPVEFSTYEGVHATTNGVARVDGNWGLFTFNYGVQAKHYIARAFNWYNFSPGYYQRLYGRFHNESEAMAAVHTYNVSQLQVAVFPDPAGNDRLFRLSFYEAASDEHYVYSWEPAGDEDLILPPPGFNVLPQPSKEDYYRNALGWNGVQAFKVARTHQDKVATWTRWDGGNLGTGLTWKSFHYSDATGAGHVQPEVGWVYFNYVSGKLRRYYEGTGWQDWVGPSFLNQPRYFFDSEAEATQGVNGNGKLAIWKVNGGYPTAGLSSGVNDPATDYDYYWKASANPPSVRRSGALPPLADAELGVIYEVYESTTDETGLHIVTPVGESEFQVHMGVHDTRIATGHYDRGYRTGDYGSIHPDNTKFLEVYWDWANVDNFWLKIKDDGHADSALQGQDGPLVLYLRKTDSTEWRSWYLPNRDANNQFTSGAGTPAPNSTGTYVMIIRSSAGDAANNGDVVAEVPADNRIVINADGRRWDQIPTAHDLEGIAIRLEVLRITEPGISVLDNGVTRSRKAEILDFRTGINVILPDPTDDTHLRIEAPALTNTEIKTKYENNPDTNAFTDSDHTKLDGIESSATRDQSSSEIKTAYESNANTNAFTNTRRDKMDGIESNATGDQTAAEIKTAYESNADTNAFTDARRDKLNGIAPNAEVNVGVTYTQTEKTKLAGIESDAAADQDAPEVAGLLESLSGDARLDASAIKNLPAGTGLTLFEDGTQIPGTITGLNFGGNFGIGVNAGIVTVDGEAGGGGGGMVFSDEIYNSDVDMVTANQFVATTFTIVAGKWYIVQIGPISSTNTIPPSGEWHTIRADDIIELEDAAALSARSYLNSRSIYDASHLGSFDVYFGATSDNVLLVSTSNSSAHIRPLRIREVTGGGSGGGSGGSGTVTESLQVLPDWDLIWEHGPLADDRYLTNSDTTDLPLITGKQFSDYSMLVVWVDNGTLTKGTFMYVSREIFATAFSMQNSGAGWTGLRTDHPLGLVLSTPTITTSVRPAAAWVSASSTA